MWIFMKNLKVVIYRVAVLLLILENAVLPAGTVLPGKTGKNVIV